MEVSGTSDIQVATATEEKGFVHRPRRQELRW